MKRDKNSEDLPPDSTRNDSANEPSRNQARNSEPATSGSTNDPPAQPSKDESSRVPPPNNESPSDPMSLAKEGNPPDMDLEEILEEMGPAGKFQLRNFILIIIPIFLCAMFNGQYVFNAGKASQRCIVAECEKAPYNFKPGPWKDFAIPSSKDKARCYQYVSKDGKCNKESFSRELKQCAAWLYENYESIVAEFDLGCQEWKRTVVGTVHSLGLMAALAFVGTLSDLFGRRHMFILTATLPSILGTIRGFSQNYHVYLLFEFLEAMAASGAFSTGYILALEMIGIEKRVIAGSLISSSFAAGQVLLALVAWLIPHWRTLTFVIYVPSIIFPTYYCCLAESIRWLYSQGQVKKANELVFKAAAMNGRTLRPETIAYLTTSTLPSIAQKKRKKHFLDEPKLIFRSRILFSRLLVISFWFATVAFIYYGLSINAVSLGGEKHVNYALLSVIEFPGYLLNVLTLDRFGRKRSITVAYVICAVSLAILPFVISFDAVVTILVLIAKMFISMVYTATYLYSAELAPTEVRHTMLALGLLFGRLGKAAAPLSPLLLQVAPYLPYIVFSASAWLAAALTHWIPETNRMKLPETLDEAEHLEPERSTFILQHRTEESLIEAGTQETDPVAKKSRWFKRRTRQ